MADPLFTRTDYRQALFNLLPRGRAWSDDPEGVLARVLEGVAGAYTAVDGAAQFLLFDAFPANAVTLLPEWEATLGLPDPCQGPNPSLVARQKQVVARFVGVAGVSRNDLITYAANLGFAITLETFTPFRMGVGGMGDPLYVEADAHTLAIHAPDTTVTPFMMGVSGMGDPFTSFGNDVLECEMSALAQAHTTVIFRYDA